MASLKLFGKLTVPGAGSEGAPIVVDGITIKPGEQKFFLLGNVTRGEVDRDGKHAVVTLPTEFLVYDKSGNRSRRVVEIPLNSGDRIENVSGKIAELEE